MLLDVFLYFLLTQLCLMNTLQIVLYVFICRALALLQCLNVLCALLDGVVHYLGQRLARPRMLQVDCVRVLRQSLHHLLLCQVGAFYSPVHVLSDVVDSVFEL